MFFHHSDNELEAATRNVTPEEIFGEAADPRRAPLAEPAQPSAGVPWHHGFEGAQSSEGGNPFDGESPYKGMGTSVPEQPLHEGAARQAAYHVPFPGPTSNPDEVDAFGHHTSWD